MSKTQGKNTPVSISRHYTKLKSRCEGQTASRGTWISSHILYFSIPARHWIDIKHVISVTSQGQWKKGKTLESTGKCSDRDTSSGTRNFAVIITTMPAPLSLLTVSVLSVFPINFDGHFLSLFFLSPPVPLLSRSVQEVTNPRPLQDLSIAF